MPGINGRKAVLTVREVIFKYRYLLGILLVTGLYAFIMFDKTMPFAEGWYTYYAECIHNGEAAYRDFDYLYTPLYLYFIAFVTGIFGYKIIVLRVVGIIFYCLIGCLVFFIMRELFRDSFACIAAIASVFYMQSEVVQVFYDYVRFMDIFTCLTVLFLVKAVKQLRVESQSRYDQYLLIAGISNAGIVLTKQNNGLVYAAYALILLFTVGLFAFKPWKAILKSLGFFLCGFCVPVFIVLVILLLNGSFFPFLKLAGSNAVAAKGGVSAILFGGFINNMGYFKSAMNLSLFVLLFLALFCVFKYSYLKKRGTVPELRNTEGVVSKFFLPAGKNTYFDQMWAFLFCMVIVEVLILSVNNKGIAERMAGYAYLSPYAVFLMIVPLFFCCSVHALSRFLIKKEFLGQELLFMTVAGSYFAVSYSCIMCGGLAEGQATIGVAWLVALLLEVCDFCLEKTTGGFTAGCNILSKAAKLIIVTAAFLITIQSAAKKMVYTYNWWGLTEPEFWSNDNLSSIDMLEGIRMSAETRQAYEEICGVLEENTKDGDAIYCFPHIPVFYNLCNRKDPGVRAKVQWMDVVSDASIIQDMDVLEQNPPKAVLIYETAQDVYQAHDHAFRNGNISATHKMRNFLLDFTQIYGYTFYGRVQSAQGNSFLLYYKKNQELIKDSFDGHGTKDMPYLIQNTGDLTRLQKWVKNGNDCAGIYFRQTVDLDLSNTPFMRPWNPIGEFNSGFYFKGIYDGRGHTISNIVCTKNDNIGLFGQLGGIVCNLGIINSRFAGSCVGVIASHSVDHQAAIVNCYTDADVNGLRAGGIADNFSGNIANCISTGEIYGMETAGGVSYYAGSIENVYSLSGALHPQIVGNVGNLNVMRCTKKYMSSFILLNKLNQLVTDMNSPDSSMYTDGRINLQNSLTYEIDLVPWEFVKGGSYPVLCKEI